MKKKTEIITVVTIIILLILLAAWFVTNSVYGEIPNRIIPLLNELGIAVPIILGAAVLIGLTMLVFRQKKNIK